jgi:hypothetical protein
LGECPEQQRHSKQIEPTGNPKLRSIIRRFDNKLARDLFHLSIETSLERTGGDYCIMAA